MSIKHHFVRLAEKIHGRKCSRCANHGGRSCWHPDGEMFAKCWQSITRPGFEYSPSVEGYNNAAAAVAGLEAGMAPGDLTEEERHQLGKIVESLQEASTTAQEAGLLKETPFGPVWEDKTDSGLLEEE